MRIDTKNPHSLEENKEQDKQIKKLAEDFESLFLEIVLKSMRKTVPEGSLVEKDNAQDIYQEMLDAEYAKTMAKRKTAGLADAIERELRSQLGKSITPQKLHIESDKDYNQLGTDRQKPLFRTKV